MSQATTLAQRCGLSEHGGREARVHHRGQRAVEYNGSNNGDRASRWRARVQAHVLTLLRRTERTTTIHYTVRRIVHLWEKCGSAQMCGSSTKYVYHVRGGTISTHSFTHMYLENETYSQRNHTSCDQCCIIARSAVVYSRTPATNTGRCSVRAVPCTMDSMGASGPMNFMYRGTETREKRRGRGSVGGIELMRRAIPRGREM